MLLNGHYEITSKRNSANYRQTGRLRKTSLTLEHGATRKQNKTETHINVKHTITKKWKKSIENHIVILEPTIPKKRKKKKNTNLYHTITRKQNKIENHISLEHITRKQKKRKIHKSRTP